jgi:hypothetical protein
MKALARRVRDEGRVLEQRARFTMRAWGRVKLIQFWTAPFEVALIFPSGRRLKVGAGHIEGVKI